ncbi:MAG: hypothetical protein GQ557_02190 [Mycoplasmataceae bacterium]|nr:hypothetical protein [Mycoplasmataceae bacterium]
MTNLKAKAQGYIYTKPNFIEELTEKEIIEIVKKNELFANALALSILWAKSFKKLVRAGGITQKEADKYHVIIERFLENYTIQLKS